MYLLDLGADVLEWRVEEQPFTRRAFIAAARDGNGVVYRLDEAAGRWVEIAESTPRVAHRLVTAGGRLLIVGGAAGGANFDLIEVVRPD